MHRVHRVCVALTAACASGIIAGCHLIPEGGMADRCASLMKQAYPNGDIDITKREAAATSLTTIVAHVEGDRTNLPSHPPIARHIAVECKFDNDVLTSFRWTAGPR